MSLRPRLLLLIAFAQGLLFVFLMPPWQHYDEPGNFEYAWLVANRSAWPQPGEYDAEMRRQVAASMIEFNFYQGKGYLPNLLLADQPGEIGVPQVGDVPLYYFLASLPLRLFRYTDITFQLYTARLVSLALFLVTIWGAAGISREVFGTAHPLAWQVPLFLAVLPPFVDLMSAVNNDVAAVAFMMLFLWGSVRILLRGLTFWRLVWLLASAAACALSKSTALLALPLLFIVLGIAVYRLVRKPILIGLAGLIVLAIPALLLSWEAASPAYFYARTDTALPIRLASDQAPVGAYVFAHPPQSWTGDGYYQMLPPSSLPQLTGKTVTLGVWLWANQPVNLRFPELVVDGRAVNDPPAVSLDTQPAFFQVSMRFPKQANLAWLKVNPANPALTVTIYADGWVLAQGEFPASSPLVFDDEQASSGSWNGQPFENLIRNASGERAWPKLRTRVSELLEGRLNFTSSHLWSVVDLPGLGWYYLEAGKQVFRTFWERFGWGHVQLIGKRFYWAFTVLSLAGLAGSLLAAWHHRKQLPWRVIVTLGIVWLGTFGITLLRGADTWFIRLFLPSARYTYPAVIAVALVLCGGWFFLFDWFAHKTRLSARLWPLIFIAGLAAYDLLAVLSILRYYSL